MHFGLITEKLHTAVPLSFVLAKVKDYTVFTKFRLASLVLLSAVAGYWLAAPSFSWSLAGYLLFGGFLVTGASNGFNQIIERDLDKLMERTKSRPLPTGKMNIAEGLALATVMGISGIFILWHYINPLSGILGAFALVSYTAIYTPMKQISPLAVYVGAIPGAIPPMIGYAAHTGQFGLEPGILFAVQFAWQFPHFWAIAWKGDEDYQKAGFKLLPSSGGKNKSSVIQILISAFILIPVSLLPVYYGISGWVSGVICGITGLWFLYLAYMLYARMDDKQATKLMFASFIYLPIVLFAFVIDKI
ncbi:heme o synthase [Flavobacteriales bacterium]|nr:heme o synthase [Flavobacteriales bacterium]